VKKYHAWWLALTGVALFFDAGLLLKLAFGVSYLYSPTDGWTLAQLLVASVFSLISAGIACDEGHIK